MSVASVPVARSSLPIPPISTSPDEQIDQLENEVSQGTKDSWEALMYKTLISRIRIQIAEMRANGQSEYVIRLAMPKILRDFHEAKDQFLAGNESFTSNKIDALVRNQASRERIDECTFDVSPIPRRGELPRECKEPDYLKANESPIDMRERKAKLAQCLLTSMDPESPFGAMPCLAHHSKGLSAAEEKELSAEVPRLVAGKVITELAAVPAAVSAVANLAIKGLVLGAAAEGLLQADPAHFQERMEEVRVAFEGQDPQFNAAVSELTPAWAKRVGSVIQKGVDYAGQVDQYTQERFYTLPGMVQQGMVGTAEIATMAVAGTAMKYSLRATRFVAQGSSRSSQVFEASAATDSAATRKIAIAAKRNAAQANFDQGLYREKTWVQTLKTQSVPLDLPKSFPQHINQFYRECQTYPFKSTKLGVNQNGILKGNLLYTQHGQEGLFVVQYSHASSILSDKIGFGRLIESVHLNWEERLGHTLDMIARAAKEAGLERVYLAWDPSKIPLATVLYHRAQPILGTSSLSMGVRQNPLLVAEVVIP